MTCSCQREQPGSKQSRGMSQGQEGRARRPTAYITLAACVEPPQLTFAGLAVCDGLAEVPVEALLAVVAVPPRGVVPAVEADSAALPARELVELHVEAAAPGVQVAVAGCKGRGEGESWRQNLRPPPVGWSCPGALCGCWGPGLPAPEEREGQGTASPNMPSRCAASAAPRGRCREVRTEEKGHV